MKFIRLAIAALALGFLGWAFAQNQEPENAPAETPPGFSPSESIRPDQGVAFPVDI